MSHLRLEILSQVILKSISTMERQDIKAALFTCGFTERRHCDFIVDTEYFNCWEFFTLVDSNAFATLGQITDFDVSATQLFRLSVLKFWIEDKYRMRKPHSSIHFRRDIDQYFRLYQAFLTAQSTNNFIPNGPKFSSDDWIGFKTGTKEILQSILGRKGVPLSYVIRDNTNRPVITPGSTRRDKIYWNAPLVGAAFNADNLCVWTYLLHQCSGTPGWIRIQQYRATNNGRNS